jgi:hypothetical protein
VIEEGAGNVDGPREVLIMKPPAKWLTAISKGVAVFSAFGTQIYLGRKCSLKNLNQTEPHRVSRRPVGLSQTGLV